MTTIDLSKASGSLAKYARGLKRDALVVTDGSKPVAVLVPVRGADRESIRVATNPKFVRILRKSRDSIRKHGGLSEEETRRELGLKPRSR